MPTPKSVFPPNVSPGRDSAAPTSRRSRIVIGGLILLALAAIAIPALGEISSRGERTWGVYGLDDNTENDRIKSLVWAIEQIDDRIYVGGKFLETRPYASGAAVSQPYLAAFDAQSGDFISSFRPELDGPVYSLQASPDGSKLFVGGEFRAIDGDNEARGLAAIDPESGAVDKTFRAKVTNASGARGVVNGLTIDGGQLYIVGRFDRVGGGPRPRLATEKLARVDINDGTADPSLVTEIGGEAVWGVAVDPVTSKIFLAGYHDSVNGDPRGADYSVLRVSDGSLIGDESNVGGNSTNPNRWYGQDVVVAGEFVFWGGSEHVVRVIRASDGSLVTQHSTDRGGDYQDLEVVGDRVYGSCHCYTNHYADHDYWTNRTPPESVEVTPIKYVAAYSAITGAYIPSFVIDASATRAGIWAIHGDPNNGCLWLGGDLSRINLVNGQDRTVGGFAQFCPGEGGDARAPQTPGNLVQTRSETKKIVLRWDSSDDNIGTDHYEVTRDGEVVGQVDHGFAAQFWFTESELAPGTTFNYEVVAVDGAGNRSAPAAIEASTLASGPENDQEPPTSPGSPTQTRAENHKIVIRFNASSDNIGVVQYQIIRDSEPVGTVTPSAASRYWYVDSELIAGTEYNYEIIAIDEAGNPSEPALVTASTTGTNVADDTEPPSEPGSPTQTRAENSKVVIRFNASTDNVGIDHYEVSRAGAKVGMVTATSRPQFWFVDSGLEPATNYDYTIVAIDLAGNRSRAATITAGTAGAPSDQGLSAPDGLRTTLQTRERIVLNWQTVVGATDYEVHRRTGDSPWETVTTQTGLWFTDRGLEPETDYEYRVVALNPNGSSEPSEILKVATLA